MVQWWEFILMGFFISFVTETVDEDNTHSWSKAIACLGAVILCIIYTLHAYGVL